MDEIQSSLKVVKTITYLLRYKVKLYIYTCAHTRIYMYTYMHAHMYTHIHIGTHVYAHIHTCMYVYTFILVFYIT